MGATDSSAAMAVVSTEFRQVLHVNLFNSGGTQRSNTVGSGESLGVAHLDNLLCKLACIQHGSCSCTDSPAAHLWSCIQQLDDVCTCHRCCGCNNGDCKSGGAMRYNSTSVATRAVPTPNCWLPQAVHACHPQHTSQVCT